MTFGRLLFAALLGLAPILEAVAGQSAWQVEWEKAVAAAEKEGQVTIYGPPGHLPQYRDVDPALKIIGDAISKSAKN